MRRVVFAIAATLACGPVLAQPAPVRHRPAAKPHATPGQERPVDVGPFTPQANGAYQGGGVVLQGAPGAPAPVPQPTAPGQVPSNAARP